jgi:hypothetical protein
MASSCADGTSALRKDRTPRRPKNAGIFFGGLSPYDDLIIADDLP